MFFMWMLFSACIGIVIGVTSTYVYLDKKFEKSVKEVLDGISDQLAQFADE